MVNIERGHVTAADAPLAHGILHPSCAWKTRGPNWPTPPPSTPDVASITADFCPFSRHNRAATNFLPPLEHAPGMQLDLW